MAHPHVFGETSLQVVFNPHGLAEVRVRWVFDEMFTTMILDEFDPNHDGAIAPEEQGVIQKGAFDNLRNFNYFTHIWVDGSLSPVKEVRAFRASVKDHKLIYEFTIPCAVPAQAKARTVVISPYDESYYTSLELAAQGAVQLKPSPGLAAEFKVGASPNRTIYYGMVHPQEVKITFRRKS